MSAKSSSAPDALMEKTLALWHPFTQEALDPQPILIDRSQGAWLYTGDGRKLLDAISSWWVNLHGHAHPVIAAAIGAQASKLEHVIFAGFTHEPALELAARLRRVLPPELAHIFFSGNRLNRRGSGPEDGLAVLAQPGQTGKKRLVALEHAYHGDTVGAMSVGADSDVRRAVPGLAISGMAYSLGLLLSLPGGKNARDLRHRMRRTPGPPARAASPRNRRPDRRAAAAGGRRDDHASGGIFAARPAPLQRTIMTCC